MKEAIPITEQTIEAAVLGGMVLGGGGGGWPEDGRRLGQLALAIGNPRLVSVDSLVSDAILVTVGLVGSPASEERYVKPIHYVRAVELLQKSLGRPVAGLITNENGATATLNGWLQSACLGLPVVDAPANGRAHPTGVMGSMGLHQDPAYTSVQVAVGGNPDRGRYVEAVFNGSLQQTAALVRATAVSAGGFVAVARNPVTAGYAKENGAPGAIAMAIDLGSAMLGKDGPAAYHAAANALRGEIVTCARVEQLSLTSEGGLDLGHAHLRDGSGAGLVLTFLNEYMTLDRGSERLGSFPDLIMTFDAVTGVPLLSAQLREGQEIALLVVPRSQLILGAGMRDPELLRDVEKMIGTTL